MFVFDLILYVLAAVCFAAAAFQLHKSRIDLIAAGLLFWVLVPLSQILNRHL